MENKVWSNIRKIDSEKLSDMVFESGYTLSALSAEIGAGDTYLSGILRKGKMSAKYIKPLCKALGVAPSTFVIDNDEPNTIGTPSAKADKSYLDYKNLDQNKRLIAMLLEIDEAIYKYVNAFSEEEDAS